MYIPTPKIVESLETGWLSKKSLTAQREAKYDMFGGPAIQKQNITKFAFK